MYHIYFGAFGSTDNFCDVSECTRSLAREKVECLGEAVGEGVTVTYMNIRLKSKKFGDLEHDSCVIHELGMLASCELSRVVATCHILRVYRVSYFNSFHAV